MSTLLLLLSLNPRASTQRSYWVTQRIPVPRNVSFNNRKIVVLGSRSIGKSSLVKRLINGAFSEIYHPTIETTVTKTITYNGTEYPCEIIDTEGQASLPEEFSRLKPHHAIGIHGYILVHSIIRRESFDMIQIIHDKILNYSGLPEIPTVIVGTEADRESRRQVSLADVEQLAANDKAAWIEQCITQRERR
ncbi:rheb small monomeric GTPase RhbA [Mycena capillaripes]|nr:rheb small monomeric GTPase RhbA [Mycena capillaripes]